MSKLEKQICYLSTLVVGFSHLKIVEFDSYVDPVNQIWHHRFL